MLFDHRVRVADDGAFGNPADPRAQFKRAALGWLRLGRLGVSRTP